ncbi:pentapeptide repeat-containing protein [Rothia mucilaginosa]|uniref:pentapeptide repeat-containing protein n=1 Tax=Rothia mucilaginosa TaxID=43675 RepID=UPI0028E7AC3F|nr:pentapeptide repeat-containing protein [Rothia mucilaginosa]
MSSNDDSPVSQPQPVEPGLPSSSNENPQTDTVDALLRIIFRMGWADWTLIATLISLLISHYFFTIFNVAQPIIDFTRLITALISVIFIASKAVSAYKSKERITIFFKNHPIQLFVSIIACGATTAFFLPLILNIFKIIGDTDKLTTALLASTGGVIAVFTLIKTHQKNQNDEMSLQLDREKYEQQKEDRLRDIEMQNSQIKEQKRQFNKKTKQEAYSSYKERIRQIYAERRSRYTTAVEQLANEKATVRLGGIYTLVGLVDEWIADDTLKSEEQQKEGQVIINNLCAYIRSPFPLAKNRDTLIPSNEVNYGITFEEDSVRLREEQETRLSIFTEISNHLTAPEKNSENKENTWNKFSYNYRESLIFYPLGNLKFANPDFSGSEFYGEAVFHNSEFIGESNFTHARFKRSAIFTISRHNCITKFDNAIFHGDTYFIGAEFFNGVSFKNSVHGSRIIFSEDSEKGAKKTVFSVKSNPKEYNFEINGIAMVSKIETEQITVADDQVFTIPMGCELFDPEPLPAPKPKEKPAE